MPGTSKTPLTAKPGQVPTRAIATALKEAIMGFRTTQLISVAAKLNLAEHLQNGPQTHDKLAALVNAHPASLGRMLRALSEIGVFEQIGDGIFCNNQTSELLLDSAPGSLRSLAVLYGQDWLWRAYAALSYSVQSGKPAFDFVHGESLYAYLDRNPDAAMVFGNAMSGYSDAEVISVLEAYDFSRNAMLMDVGGGQGAFLSALIKAAPNLSGTVFDLSHVIASSPLLAAGKDTRITLVSGDFFNEVPPGADVYLLKSVLHNWDDTSCIQILRNCRKAMRENARLLVLERVIPGGHEKSEAKLFDINMLVVTGGCERTGDQYGKLFKEAGFTLSRVVSTQSPLSIVEGLPAC